jgi:GAF domain-containing protein/HAMP domain-containing protein
MNLWNRFTRWFTTGHLIRRPATVLLVVVLPILFGIITWIGSLASNLLQDAALANLTVANQAVAESAATWLDYNARALLQMVAQEEIWQMEADAQKIALETMAAIYPHMYLVSTTDLNGINIARSDDEANKDYSSREWFTLARLGNKTFVYQTLIGATSGQPAIVVATPIRNDRNEIVGVGMFASELTVLSEQVQANSMSQRGAVYIVDGLDRIIVHPNMSISAELRDASAYPAVIKLRKGFAGPVRFEDETGQPWRAYLTTLENGWGVIAQQPEDEIFAEVAQAQRVGLAVVVGGIAIIFVVFALVARSVIRPIADLTETAVAIAQGDLNRRVQISSRDELGTLSQAFNDMTDQLQHIQANLEGQVAQRTAELQARTAELEANSATLQANARALDERSAYLQAVADVSQIIATMLDPDELSAQVVDLVRERFNLYYVGLFQVDAAGERAWLVAGTGQAGQAMLARKHAIQVGTGMIGWSIAHGEPRIALQAGEDEVRLATPDLPETRSEAALPLRSRGVVIGALSIQSAVPNDFNDENIAVFQMMADQVAVALDNARLYRQSQEALQSLRETYGQQSFEGWNRLLKTRADMAYRVDAQGLAKAREVWYPEMDAALRQGDLILAQPDARNGEDGLPLALPIKVRGQVIGVLDARRDLAQGHWQPDDVAFLQTVVEQLGVALESAQLYQETQSRAERERLVAEITSKLRASNDPKEILQTAASELRRALRVKDARVLLRSKGQAEEDLHAEIGVAAVSPAPANGQE